MQLLRSLLFNFFLYTGIVVVFLIALPALFLPTKITLIFGKFLGHYVVFVVKIFLNTKVEFKGIENIHKSKCIESIYDQMYSLSLKDFRKLDAISHDYFISECINIF